MNRDRLFATAWVKVWVALGGSVHPPSASDRTHRGDDLSDCIRLGIPEPNSAARLYGLPNLDAEPHLQISSPSEWAGALKVLQVFADEMPDGINSIGDLVAELGPRCPTPKPAIKAVNASKESDNVH